VRELGWVRVHRCGFVCARACFVVSRCVLRCVCCARVARIGRDTTSHGRRWGWYMRACLRAWFGKYRYAWLG